MKRLVPGVVAALLAACGGEAPVEETAALQPLEPGSTWTYQTTDPDGSDAEEKTTTVVGTEDVEGAPASILETRRGDIVSRVWLSEISGVVLRVREDKEEGGVLVERRRFVPGSVRTPARLEGLRVGDELPGANAEELGDGAGSLLMRRDVELTWVVEAIDDAVQVPAGSFRAVRLRKVGGDGTEGKLVWYAPGVGKVKEQGGKHEVLASFRIGG